MTFDILKVKDITDTYYTKVPIIFDLPFRLAIIGKSQISLGKTSIILNLLLRDKYYKKYFKGENIYIITNNKLDNKLKILREEKEIPDCNVMEFDEERLEILYEILEEEFDEEEKKQNRLIIFDDVAYSNGLKGSQVGIMSKMAMNGRHMNLSQIYTSQKYSLVGTNIRTQLTGALIGGVSAKELDLIEQDLNFLENKKEFIKMFRQNTKNRDFLVVNFSNEFKDRYMDKNFKPIDIVN